MTASTGNTRPKPKSSKVQVIVERPEKSRKGLWITIVVLGVLLIGAYGNRATASVPAPTPAVTASSPATGHTGNARLHER